MAAVVYNIDAHEYGAEEHGAALKTAVAAERERCAKIVGPKNEKPCDCIEQNEEGVWLWTCNCHNDGDLCSATAWCEAMNFAAAIRKGE